MLFSIAVLHPAPAHSQDPAPYILGERQGLEMIVHIIGEVQKPGEYRVPDRTNLLELVSKAGGPTTLARLSSITIRRTGAIGFTNTSTSAVSTRDEILHLNLERSLNDRTATPIMLQPGDVVLVPKNSRQKWLDGSALVRDLSIIASAYFLYLRSR